MADNDLGLPGLPQERIDAARAAGHSNEDIQGYWSRKNSGVTMEAPGSQVERGGINRSQGEDFLPRMLASFKSTPQERTDFWKKYRGAENVKVAPDGELLVRRGRGCSGCWSLRQPGRSNRNSA